MNADEKPTVGDVFMAVFLILLLSSPITIGLWFSYPDPYPTVNVNHTATEETP